MNNIDFGEIARSKSIKKAGTAIQKWAVGRLDSQHLKSCQTSRK